MNTAIIGNQGPDGGELGLVGVVVVSFNPDEGFAERLEAIHVLGGPLIVVDNSESADGRQRVAAACATVDAVLLANDRNLGIATALNQGTTWLRDRQYSWALLFDQDSTPDPRFLSRLTESIRCDRAADLVAVVGGNFVDTGSGVPHRVLCRHWFPGLFRKQRIVSGDADVTMVITSGSLVRLAALEELAGFDDDLFIDYVDTDFCLRCLERGYRVRLSANAVFRHQFGDRSEERFLGIRLNPTNHSALRHYYIARNRIHMWRRHAWKIVHWATFDASSALLWLIRVLLVEESKRSKVRAMILGAWDGLRGRLGPCPEARLRVLLRR